jgi:hypothetical protein
MGCPSVFKGIIIIFFGTNPSSLKYPGTMGEPFCVRNNIVFRSEKVCWGLEEDVPVKILAILLGFEKELCQETDMHMARHR